MALVGGRKSGPKRSMVSVHDSFYSKNTNKITKRKLTVLSGTDTEQKTRSHKTQIENYNIYMIPNQRQQ
jgi:hypothetical protein